MALKRWKCLMFLHVLIDAAVVVVVVATNNTLDRIFESCQATSWYADEWYSIACKKWCNFFGMITLFYFTIVVVLLDTWAIPLDCIINSTSLHESSNEYANELMKGKEKTFLLCLLFSWLALFLIRAIELQCQIVRLQFSNHCWKLH